MSKKAKLLTANQVGNRTNGTSLKGKLLGVTYNDLLNTFGEPTFTSEDFSDDKVNFEWVFEYGDDVFTVYDWKVEESYARHLLGKEGEVQFHVGGHGYSGDFESHIECTVLEKVMTAPIK